MNEPYTPEQTEAIRFFLRECQGAQQPRYRVLRCAEELAKVPIQEVAKIAAMLVHNASSAVATNSPVKKDGDDEKPASGGATSKRVDEQNRLVVAAAKAYELLEIAYYGNRGLKNWGSYEAGLANFAKGKRIDEEGLEAEAKIPTSKTKYDDYGKKVPEPFEEGLKRLIPKPGVPKAKEAEVRLVRFRLFLAESWVEIKPEQNEQDRSKEVEELIAKLKREGIPPKDFDKWWVMFPEWWRRRKSTMNSCNASRKRTTGDKKGKQGRVRSTTDKRLGPRIPAFKQT